jgi:hypothetical protein
MKDAGTATVAEIARHWAIAPATARRIVRTARLPDVGQVRARYRWIDIWKIEGEVFVPPADYAEMRQPLLRIAELAALDPRPRPASDRTMRRYARTGVLPDPSALKAAAAVLSISVAVVEAHYAWIDGVKAVAQGRTLMLETRKAARAHRKGTF